jgi:glycine betaine/choline ABC-type transport system substrate-binding protein
MMSRCVWIILTVLIVGCGSDRSTVVVGSNDYSEQKILAEIMALVLEDHGVRVERRIPSGDNRYNLLALQSGTIDLYPAYDGYLETLVRYPVADGESATPDGRAVAAGLKLALLEPFGYRSDFAVAVRRDVAIRDSLETISDLTRLQKPLRFATDQGHASRTVDGLRALARRYGFELADVKLIPLRDRAAAYSALLDREVDAAIVFSVDAQAGSFGMRILEDDLEFFPAYRAAPLLRDTMLQSHPEIGSALAALGGRIDEETIRQLVRSADYSGEDYRVVAREFLGSVGLLEVEPIPSRDRAVLRLGVEPMAQFDELAVRAYRAIHEVLPARHLVVETTTEPVAALIRGEVRYALLGADAFFELADGRVGRVTGIEAVGVAGSRFAHLVARRETAALDTLQQIRIGVGPAGGSSHRIAEFLASESEEQRVTLVPIANPQESVRSIQSGEVDAVFLMGSTGHAGLMALLADDAALELRPVDEVISPATLARFPFLRAARIPAGSYPGQSAAVESFSTQAVLAAGRLEGTPVTGDAGPANIPGLRIDEQQRVRPRTAEALHVALGRSEDVDSILPMSSGLLPSIGGQQERIQFQPTVALFNVIAITFLIWVISLLFRPLPENPALRSGDTRDASMSGAQGET